MSDEHAAREPHGIAAQGRHGDDHHDPLAEPSLGPIDWPAWGAAALGVAIAGFVALLMAFVVGIL